MGFESEKRKRLIKIGFNIVLILILVIFLLVKVFGGGSADKTFNEVETMIKSQTTIEEVAKNLKDMKDNKGVLYQITPSEDKKTYKIDVKIDEEVKSYTYTKPNTDNSNQSESTSKSIDEKTSTDKKETTTNNNFNGNLNNNSTDEVDAKKAAKEEAKKQAEKMAANEKATNEKALYDQVKFSIKNNKILDTLKDDLNDIGTEAKKKDITFTYSIKDKLQGEYIIVTEIDDVTYRDNFSVDPELAKTEQAKIDGSKSTDTTKQ